MMPFKPSLTICAQNKIGGVQFFYDNLVCTGAFDSFDVHYLVMDEHEDPGAKLLTTLRGAPNTPFEYSTLKNGYSNLRRLARKLPASPGLVLTNWIFELACLDNYRKRHLTIAHVCHDEYYVDIALKYAHIIDVFIAHNPYFAERLKTLLPASRAGDVHFLPFGIRQDAQACRTPNSDRPLRVVYIGRLTRIKGALELPAVDDHLSGLGVKVQWSVLGRGPEQAALERAIAGRDNFTLESPMDNAAMLRKAAEGDVFVLPSRLDGTPLSVMEAMSVGLVPIVSEYNPGAFWMVPSETGFVCPIEPAAIAAIIAKLDSNRVELEVRSQAARAWAQKEFEVGKKARGYADFLSQWRELKRPVSGSAKHYGGGLDQPWLPSPLVVNLRQLRTWLRSRRKVSSLAI